MIRTETNQESNLLEVARDISSMDTEYVSTLTIKAQPEVEDGIENVQFEGNEPDSNLFMQLQNGETMENVKLDQYYCHTAFSQPDYESPTYFSAQLKSETTNDIENMGGIVFEDWKIINKEESIKEDLEEKETRTENDEIDELVRVKSEEAIEGSDYIPDIESWTIKHEELYLKEENLEVGETGISPNGCQNREDTPIYRPKEHRQYETQTRKIGSSKKHRVRHMNADEEKEFKCSNCEYKTHWKGALKRHLLKYIPEKLEKFKCSQCEFVTNHKTSLKRHLILHLPSEKVNNFKCKQCEYQTIHKTGLKRHLVTHLPPEKVTKFKCNQCEFQALEKRTVKRHLLTHMDPGEVHKCSICEFRTHRISDLKQHVFGHMNSVNTFKCSHCGFETFNKGYLKLHLLRHGNPEAVNKFKCSQCKYETLQKCHLKRHLLRHMNPELVNMFKCSHCEYRTLYKGNLKLHSRRHVNPEEVEKFKCEYKTKRTLKRHLPKHMNPEAVINVNVKDP